MLLTDAELIALSINAPERFAEVFDRHYDEIRAFAYRRLGPEHADDIAAEAFARAFAQRTGFDQSHESARPWLFGISSNLIRMNSRTESRRLRAYARSDIETTADFAGAAADRASDEVSATAMLAKVARLGRKDREVLLLHAWADLTSAEIGEALGIPGATVRTRLARARKKLAASMEPDQNGISNGAPAAPVAEANGVEQ
jgi:RNA polymerase sigma-70 factor (ECF subfamily)